MAERDADQFLSGVIEGFYGPPWSVAEREEVLSWMQAWGLNTYFYGPKDDLHHRIFWRSPYSDADAAVVGRLIRSCEARGIRFIYAIGPGLDTRYNDPSDREALKGRFAQLVELGCRNFCLLFDDIPDRMRPEEIERWGCLASAQSAMTNELFAWVSERAPGARFLFCPTPYCGRMEAAGLGGPGYLETVGRELDPGIDVFWTGTEIISRSITLEETAVMTTKLRRKPMIWDNLHANDYDGRRFYCGPYSGRDVRLKERVKGILTNPNNEMPLDFMALRTLAAYVAAGNSWDPRAAYEAGLREWLPKFETVHQSMSIEDLTLLADCYYLPHQDGAAAARLFADIAALLARDPSGWGAEAALVRAEIQRLRDICARLAELKCRPLFHALSRRVWELREEMDLLDRYFGFVLDPANAGRAFHSDFHLTETYRGGLVPRLQALLVQSPDGSIRPRDLTGSKGGAGA
jgi:protein O-GlcNAcase/histone acetyltransferase